VFDDDTGIVEYGATFDVGQPLHLLDQVADVEGVKALRAQKLRLLQRPDIEILVIQVLLDRLDPGGHRTLQHKRDRTCYSVHM
jgi:hypothetical protein